MHLQVFGSLDEAAAAKDTVFDLATPPGQHYGVLEHLPPASTILIQKPMGRDLED